MSKKREAVQLFREGLVDGGGFDATMFRAPVRPVRAGYLPGAVLGESTRLEVSGWMVMVWNRWAMYSLSKCSA